MNWKVWAVIAAVEAGAILVMFLWIRRERQDRLTARSNVVDLTKLRGRINASSDADSASALRSPRAFAELLGTITGKGTGHKTERPGSDESGGGSGDSVPSEDADHGPGDEGG